MSRPDRHFRTSTLPILVFAFFAIFCPGSTNAVAQGAKLFYASSMPFTGFSNAIGIAVDSAGNIFIADQRGGHLYKETPNGDGTYTQSTLTTDASQPCGVAVDAGGNLYVSNSSSPVYKETYSGGSYSESTVAKNFSLACGLALDGSGDVFIMDLGASAVYKETLSAGNYTRSTIATGLGGGINASATGVAVDKSGNVYIADSGNNRIPRRRGLWIVYARRGKSARGLGRLM